MPPITIDSNQTGLAFAEETSLKTLPGTPIWYALEPNSYPSDFGASYKMVARTPITNTRQKNKGVVTDLDVKGGFNTDFTKRNLQRLLQGHFWATIFEKPDTQPINGTQITLTAVTATQFQAAAGLSIFKVGHLAFAENMNLAADNGMFHITAVAAGAVTTDKALSVDAAPAATAKFLAIGFQGTAGDITLTVAGAIVTLGSTTVDFTTLGFNVGEWIWIGGDSAPMQFATAADRGFARISAITAHAISLDICNFVAVTDNGATKTIQIFFGRYLQNATVATSIVRRSYTFERQLGNDGVGIQAEYLLGCIADQATFTMKEASKLTCDLTYIGMNVQNNDGTIGILAGTRINALGEDAYNTSLDQVISKVYILDPTTFNPTPLYGYCTDSSIVLNNKVTPNKALGTLGAIEASASYFDVSGKLTAYFTEVDSVAAIRKSESVGYVAGFAKENGGFIFDIPLLTLGGGLNKVTQDKPITVDLTQDAAKNPNNYTAAIAFFTYLPNIAMPS